MSREARNADGTLLGRNFFYNHPGFKLVHTIYRSNLPVLSSTAVTYVGGLGYKAASAYWTGLQYGLVMISTLNDACCLEKAFRTSPWPALVLPSRSHSLPYQQKLITQQYITSLRAPTSSSRGYFSV